MESSGEKKAPDLRDFAVEFKEIEDILDRLEVDARSLTKDAPPKSFGGDREVLERELAQSRESITNLMLRISRERRHARATMLVVKRRLRSYRRSGKTARAAETRAAMAAQLAESRATIASLLVEVSRRERRAKAERLLRGRTARGGKTAAPQAAPADDFLVRAACAASLHLDDSLRAFAAGSPAGADAALDECRRFAHILRLCALLSTPAEHKAKDVELRTALSSRLDDWEPEFQRRHATLVRDIPGGGWSAAVPPAELNALLDALVGQALARSPRAGTVLARLATNDGPPRVDIQYNGAEAPKIPEPGSILAAGGRLTGLDDWLARELAERHGILLIASPVPSGRGLRVSLQFGSKKGSK